LLGDRVFVGCLPKEDLAYVTSKLGDDFSVTATDFPHGDPFREDQLVRSLESRGDLSQQTIQKILADNPKRLYHF
jgi:predicted TIM-barrel fold metal-dependent hydrolase